jgi:hypothetical protein
MMLASRPKLLLPLGLAIMALALSPAPQASETLTGLPPHPRLLTRPADWERLKLRLASEPDLAAYHAALLAEARKLLPLPPVERKMTGRRLLHVSRELLRRITLWGYAWRMTGEPAFAQRAGQEMLAAARFKDWNPSHFLDVGEATAALALGYDWLYPALAPEVRTEIRTAILEQGLRPGLDPAASHNGWHRRENNWNQVCFGGLTLGALAIGDEAGEVSRQVLSLARAHIANGLKPYAPDGVYPEGPGYWVYGTSYQVLMIAALQSALGTDWQLPAAPGFLASAGAFLQPVGPTGSTYNFADAGRGTPFAPVLFWFARAQRDPGLASSQRQRLTTPAAHAKAVASNYAVLAALWWPEPSPAEAPALPLDWHGRGENPLVIFRDSWTDPASAYLAAKGGSANLSHAHMDAGSFIYEADGVRWAQDLGAQSYESLESKGIKLFARGQDSDRWTVYRLNNFSHNTLTLGGQLHRVEGHATVTRFSTAAGRRFATLDLSPVFAGQASRVHRGFHLQPDRGFVVQDEISGCAPGRTIRWQMATEAQVAVHGDTATLTQAGRTLTARILAPSGARFNVAPAAPPDDGFNAPNPGMSLLGIDLSASDSPDLTIAVQFSPGGTTSPPAGLGPLATW